MVVADLKSTGQEAPWLSIVIPVRGKENELWFTLQGLLNAGLEAGIEVLVVDNEPSKDVRDVCELFGRPGLRYLEAGTVKGVNYPRSFGASVARGQWLLMLDSHVLMKPGSFALLRERIRSGVYPAKSLIHFGVSFGSPEIWGAYRLTLESNFWGTWHHLVDTNEQDPYPIGATGNWALLTRLSDWVSIGGFNDAFRGYGGDEIYLQLKYWQSGGQVLLDPQVSGSHWSGPRAYGVTPMELVVNTAIAGRVVVGSSFLARFGDALVAHYCDKGMKSDAVRSALHRGVLQAQLSDELTTPRQWSRSFDDVLAHWRDFRIPV